MEDLLKSLIAIQGKLCVPKSQFNNFGKYAYRSLEDIEAVLKPLLQSHNCGIRFCDEIVEHSSGRTFLKTTLFFFNSKGESISVTAEAEHASEKSGMDKSQITGAASSYARKYALNGLFAIDDTKDADTNEYQGQTTQTVPPEQKPIPSTSKRTTRKAMTPSIHTVPQPTPQPQYDRYAGIRQMLSTVQTVADLVKIWNEHKSEVEGNDEIKALFTARKNELTFNAA